MTIIEFLEARLAEDERWVRALEILPDTPDWVQFRKGFNSARVLREVAAKRALIKSTVKRIEQGWGYHDNEGIVCADLRPMAEVYSDHPDFTAIEWE